VKYWIAKIIINKVKNRKSKVESFKLRKLYFADFEDFDFNPSLNTFVQTKQIMARFTRIDVILKYNSCLLP
jgi:hypothetical protein